MKVTQFGPGSLPLALAGWSTGVVSVNSNFNTIDGGLTAVNFVQRITANGSNVLLNPIVNFASGSNILLTLDQGPLPAQAYPSNTIRIHSTAGGGGNIITSNGSNSLAAVVNLVAGSGIALGVSGQDITITNTGSGGGGGGSSSETYAQAITAIGGAVHRWKFDESSGNFADSIGSLTLTASGSFTYSVTAPLGGAVTFGASAKGQASGIGSIPSGSAARTFVAVYKGHSGKAAIGSYGTSGSTRQWWTMFLNDSADPNLGLAMWADDLNTPAIIDNRAAEWHISAWAYDGNVTSKIFHDSGYSYAWVLLAALNTGSGTDFRIGITTGGGNQFAGSIDDLVVFNSFLTNAQLQRLGDAFRRAVFP